MTTAPISRPLRAVVLLATLAAGATLAQAQGQGYPATPMPVMPQPSMAPAPLADDNEPWRHVVPEPGVVVSGDGTAYGPAYPQPAAVYAPYPPQFYAPPFYVQPAYAWPQPYIYPPIGISLGIGYARGWHGGWRGRGWR